MIRTARQCVPGYPHHVVQRGNNRCPIFHFSDDFVEYLTMLGDAARKSGTQIHAYSLMSNHVHLLLTPDDEAGISKMMQLLGTRYVPYMNRRYKRSGTLWEGRFRSSLIDSDRYCITCYQYIELNPVRAELVNSPLDYIWSSCRHNALGERNDLITPHLLYESLGRTRRERLANYQSLLDSGVSTSDVELLRAGALKGEPVGNKTSSPGNLLAQRSR